MSLDRRPDLDTTVAALREWLATRLDSATDVRLDKAMRPTSNGASNDTVMVDANWREGQTFYQQGMVFRLRPLHDRLFLDDQFEVQFRILQMLERYNAPTPRAWWYEPDESVVGAAFWVMERVTGEVPSDQPPYREHGFVHDADPPQRHQLWASGVDTLAALHSLPITPEDLNILSDQTLGPTGLTQELARLRRYWQWASGGEPDVVMDAALQYLDASLPTGAVPGLSWGDARLGNMVFRDFHCVALLDWEQVSIAGPLKDVAWWRYADTIVGAEPLQGFGSNDDLLDRWAKATGYPIYDLPWFEILSGAWFVTIFARMNRLAAESGTLSPFAVPFAQRVNGILAERLESVGA